MEEIQIDNLNDFIKLIIQNKNEHFYHDIAHLQVVYRGHADANWLLLPSAFRDIEDFLNESIYLKECIREAPDEFVHSDYLDTLVKAQHYGVPTRLLDFSLNPLVALYFACSDESRDGCVFVFDQIAAFYPDDFVFQLIMHYLFKYKHGADWDKRYTAMLSKSLQNYESKYYLSTVSMVDEMLQREPAIHFVFPKLTNARIRAQQGVFALFTTKLNYRKYDNGNEYGRFQFPNEESFPHFSPTQKIVVPKEKKNKLLIGLDCIGVNQMTLFPELEQHTHYLVNKIRRANRDINSRILKTKGQDK